MTGLAATNPPTRVTDFPAEWRRVSRLRGVVDITWIWALTFALAAAASRLSPWLLPVFMIVIGALQNHFSSLLHHSIHNNLHPSRTVNDSLSKWLVCSPIGQSFSALRAEHLKHHAHFGAEDDPERAYYDLDSFNRRSPLRFVLWLAVLFCGWVVYPTLRRVLMGSRGADAGPGANEDEGALAALMPLAVAQAVLFGVFWAATGTPWGYVLYWVLPLITFGAGLNVLRATIEHADPRSTVPLLMTFVSNPIERSLVGPLGFNWHYEHHRFMSIPYYHVAKVRQFLIEAGDYDDAIVESSYSSRIVKDFKGLRAARPANLLRGVQS